MSADAVESILARFVREHSEVWDDMPPDGAEGRALAAALIGLLRAVSEYRAAVALVSEDEGSISRVRLSQAADGLDRATTLAGEALHGSPGWGFAADVFDALPSVGEPLPLAQLPQSVGGAE